ncbi:MAG: phosphatase PAP2 family protein [Chlorobiota bacterium]
MTEIVELDKQLFYFINQDLANPITDYFMPIITSFKYWLPLYIFGFLYLLVKYRLKGLYILFVLLFIVGLCDLINAQVLKEYFARVRPCRDLSGVNLLINCGSGLSFPSNHAVNNFSAAVVLSHFFRRKVAIFFTIAFLVSISRVFVGVHYVVDITAGAIVGMLIATLFTTIVSRFKYNKEVIEKIRIS